MSAQFWSEHGALVWGPLLDRTRERVRAILAVRSPAQVWGRNRLGMTPMGPEMREVCATHVWPKYGCASIGALVVGGPYWSYNARWARDSRPAGVGIPAT